MVFHGKNMLCLGEIFKILHCGTLYEIPRKWEIERKKEFPTGFDSATDFWERMSFYLLQH
jgi:hypothetical protein